MMRRALLLVPVLALAACSRGDRDPAAERRFASRALTGVLAFPQSNVAGVATGTEAAEVTFTTHAEPAQVAAWYRQTLYLNKWELRSDVPQSEGMVMMHAMKDGRPLWITIRPSVGGPGTTYTLVGVVLEGDSIR
jgi:hypothetical protein